MGQLNKTTEKVNELLDKVDGIPEEVKDGKTPVLETGTTTTLDPGSDATSEVVANGTDDNGNPKYKLNFGIPKGYDGAGGSGGGGTADSVQWANVLNKPSWVNSATKPEYTASEVGALPASTTIPSKTSQLTNDSGFLKKADFKTVNGQSIVGSGNIVIEGGGGGGDTPSSGGNVNVTNGASLETGKQYAFKPSADGSLKGTFTTIPAASSTANGLMSSADKSKLDDMKQVWKVPSAVLGLTDESTSDEIVEAFGMPISNFHVRIASCVDNLQAEYKAYNSMKAFIGNYECLLSGHVTDGQYTIDFNYVDAGTLKTISIIQVPGGPITFACKLSESGGGSDDTYWLPVSVYKLSAGATREEILAALGDTRALSDAVAEGKKIYIKGNYLFSHVSIPVSVSILGDILMISFPFVSNSNSDVRQKIIRLAGDAESVKVIYPEGYKLNSSVFELTSSSESDDISTAVGGESGLKEIIQAIKDGNRLVIRGKNDSSAGNQINQDLMCNMYKEEENGDILLVLSGIGYGLFGGIAGFLSINYTKSSNTFSCGYTSIS